MSITTRIGKGAPLTFTEMDNNFLTLAGLINAGFNYSIDVGTVNTIVITLSAPPTSYIDGMNFSTKIANTTTGAATLNVNGLGAKNIYDQSGILTSAGTLIAGQIYTFVYNSSLNSGSGGFNAFLLNAVNLDYVIPSWTTANSPITVGSILNEWLGASSNPTPVANQFPVGNTIATTNANFSIVSTTTSSGVTAIREYAMELGLNINTGSTELSPGVGDKCTLYVGAVANPGGGNAWAFNPLITVNTGWTGCTTASVQSAQCAEFDLNNLSGTDYGPATGGAYGNPSLTGVIITGASTNFCTAALQIVGSGHAGGPMWRFGIWLGNNSISNTTIWDNTNSQISYVINGTHQIGIQLTGGTFTNYGIDLNQATITNSALLFGNNQLMSWRNAANSADLPALQMTSGNNLNIGGTGVGAIVALSSFVPSPTNTLVLGQSTNVWAAVWAEQHQVTADRNLIFTNATNGGGSGAGTLTNAPAAGNPTFWLKTSVNGTNYQLPLWPG